MENLLIFSWVLQNNPRLNIWVILCQMSCDAFVIKKFSTAWHFFAMTSIWQVCLNYTCEICSKDWKGCICFHWNNSLWNQCKAGQLFASRLKENLKSIRVYEHTRYEAYAYFELDFMRLCICTHTSLYPGEASDSVYLWHRFGRYLRCLQ